MEILPTKVAIDAAYLRRRSPALDAWIIWRTVLVVAGRPPSMADVETRLGIPLPRLADPPRPD
jgi:lipopolysaccharide/colanic/teichoic acid biosynthesis glycosyltransferase